MSDRPEDYPENPTEPEQGPAGQGEGEGEGEAAWRAVTGWAPETPAMPGPEAPWWQQPHGQPHAEQPHAVQSPWGYAGGPHDPYGQGSHWTPGPWGWTQPGGGWGPAYPQAPAGTGRRKGLAAMVATSLTLLALLVGVGIGYGVWNGRSTSPSSGHFVLPGGTSNTSTSTSSAQTSGTGKISSATGAPSNIATIAAKVTPALVDINTVLGYQTDEAAGTGMVLTPTGKVLTNNHVIEGSTKITVTDLGNGKVYPASVLGYTRTQDVAVIQLKGASGLKTVHIGNSSAVRVGEAIVGIGNAGGTGGRPSAAGGSVTALNQAITASDQGSLSTTTEHLTGLIESNANIQPGDSGGPLVTTSGTVVGMDTAASAAQGYSLKGAATGQGYSIPINEALALAHQIISGKSTAAVHIGGTPFLGVYVESTATRTPFGGFGSTITTSTRTSTAASGAVVAHVIPGTPAQNSGLVQGDVIINVAGTAVTSPSGLTKIMLRYHPGDSVRVVWTTRSGQSQSATVALAAGPAD